MIELTGRSLPTTDVGEVACRGPKVGLARGVKERLERVGWLSRVRSRQGVPFRG